MSTLIPNIDYPELFFGFVAPIGVDVSEPITHLKESLIELGYLPVEIKVTKIFSDLFPYIKPAPSSHPKNEAERYRSYIKYGNKIREHFNDDAALSVLTIAMIIRKRMQIENSDERKGKNGVAYLIHQFKRKEEIQLLRSLYGSQFFQISLYSRRGARVDFLARRFASTDSSPNRNAYRASAEEMVQIDYNEAGNLHGQRIEKIFHDAEIIINNDIQSPSARDQLRRFCHILFGANDISPTKMEYGMYMAKAAAL